MLLGQRAFPSDYDARLVSIWGPTIYEERGAAVRSQLGLETGLTSATMTPWSP